MIIVWISAIGIAFLGWGIRHRQWYFLISGYNMMSPEEQAKVDVQALAKKVAIMCYLIAVLLALLAFSIQLEIWTFMWIVTALLIIVPIVFAIAMQASPATTIQQAASPKTKKIGIIITVCTLLGVGIIMYFSMQPTSYSMEAEALTINGMYGDTMRWDELTELQLVDTLPAIAARTNGSAVGSKLKGHFKLKDGNRVTLFVDKAVAAYITFTWQNDTYYINAATAEETRALYEQMQQFMKY